MCYNYEISITTWVVGTILTIINAYLFRDSAFFSALNIGWYSPILMQLWEALIWKDYHCELITKLAMITNLLQPLVPLLLLLLKPGKYIRKNPNLFLIAAVCAIYVFSILPYFSKDYGCIRDEDRGVELVWWNRVDRSMPDIPYAVTMIILVLQIMTRKAALPSLFYFFISLVAGNGLALLFPNGPNPLGDEYKGKWGSLWCWVASFVPIYNLLLFKYFEK
jgi:hypothetical protein